MLPYPRPATFPPPGPVIVMRYLTLVLALVLLMIPLQGLAAQQARVGVLGGVSVPTGNMKERRESGRELGAVAMLEWTRWTLRTDFTYTRFPGKTAGPLGEFSFGDLTNVAVHANLLYLRHEEPFRHYLLFGTGLHRLEGTRGSFNPYGWTSGVQAGAGLRFSVRRVALFAETRWAIIFSDYGNDDFKPSTFVPISVGVLF